MNNRTLLKYLNYFSENNVDLSIDNNEREKISEIFGWEEFLENLETLEVESLILENNDRFSYSITEKGKITLKELKNELAFEDNKQNIELENLKTSTEANKFILRTKWLPHIIALLSLLFSIYIYFDNKNDSKKLEERINNLENKSEAFINK